MFAPCEFEQKGFRAAFTLVDKASKLELGVLSVSVNSDGSARGTRFKPNLENSPQLSALYESQFDKHMREMDERIARGEFEVIEEGEPQI